MDKLVCVQDFEIEAHRILDRNTLDYYKSGADEEETLRDNKAAFKRWIIIPRMLRDVTSRDLTTQVLGKPVSFPIGISPSAMQKLAHEEGECATARAAAALNTIYIQSTIATSSMEEVAEASPRGRRWFQLYIYKDRQLSVNLIRRAEACGFEALVLTVDAPYFGKRRENIRNKFILPKHLRLANFQQGTDSSDGLGSRQKGGGSALNDCLDKLLDQSLSWEDVDWLKKTTRLPIVLKGIMTPEDAGIAIQHGVAGVFVSNHGGRQLDTVPATIDVLEEIVKEVDGKCDVYLDGGVTNGTDVYKALALGAKMVFAGRPFLWGLAVGGEAGCRKVLEILRDELDLTMTLSGVCSIPKLTRQMVARYSKI